MHKTIARQFDAVGQPRNAISNPAHCLEMHQKKILLGKIL